VSLTELAFFALAVVALVTAILALLVRELVHTILWIALFFVDLSAIYFLLEAPFLGVLQLGVYAGAVTILLLFGIMVTRKRIFSREAATGLSAVPTALAVVTFIFLIGALGQLPSSSVPTASYPVAQLSTLLFNAEAPYLLLLGLVMLGALSGAIYLVREGRE
jgi:NADH-quinone oxidoreductase subunit J